MKNVLIGGAALLSVAISLSAGPSTPGHSQVPQSKTQPQSAAACLCYLSANNISNQPTPAGAVHSVPLVGAGTCQARCAAGTSTLVPQTEANILCHPSVNAPNGATVRTYYKDGTANFRVAALVGVLTNTPLIPSSQWQCPPTWYSNTVPQLGGITTDQKCKRQVGSISGVPGPPNTPIGSWGFTWGNEIWAFGTSANGGAAFHPSTPAQCHF